MPTALTYLSFPLFHHHHHSSTSRRRRRHLLPSPPFFLPPKTLSYNPFSLSSTPPQQLLHNSQEPQVDNNKYDPLSDTGVAQSFNLDDTFDSTELKKFDTQVNINKSEPFSANRAAESFNLDDSKEFKKFDTQVNINKCEPFSANKAAESYNLDDSFGSTELNKSETQANINKFNSLSANRAAESFNLDNSFGSSELKKFDTQVNINKCEPFSANRAAESFNLDDSFDSSELKKSETQANINNFNSLSATGVAGSFNLDDSFDSTELKKFETQANINKCDLISDNGVAESFNFDDTFDSTELKKFETPAVEVSELEDIPDQWRRARLAWLCKELPAHKTPTMVRILNAQRKWFRQEDGTYIAVHCMRIRENEAAFRVYKWMMQQHWFRFDFALATKLADYLGKERKHLKCREIFDDIINQGRVPCESTFHILIIAYLSSPGPSELDEACNIYNSMVHLGGYKPRLNLHNSLFKALLGKTRDSGKHFLKQAEFIYQNLASSGLEIHTDIFSGLIWLHSYQDVVDMERIAELRAEMRSRGIKESKEVLVSVLRACSKDGNVEEAERTWLKLLSIDGSPPSQAFVYRMEVYAKIGEPTKSLEVFRRMQEQLGSTSVVAYHRIIKALTKYQKQDLADSIMSEFINSGMKQLIPSFIDLMGMYSDAGLHEKLESTFLRFREVCHPNLTVFNIYLDSLVDTGNMNLAEKIFNEMRGNVEIGVDSRSCNSILRGYLTSGEYVKAVKICNWMHQKKYDVEVESSLMKRLDYVLSLREKVVEEPIRLKLTPEQREILIGLLLGGVQIRSDGKRRLHAIHYEFNEESRIHSIFKGHIRDMFHEWLGSHDMMVDSAAAIPNSFTTISHSCFNFYADQFWPNGRPCIPKLIHRWLSPRVLAYWYMYGGYRTSSGDILVRVKGSSEGVVRILKALKAKSLDCRAKKRGRVVWIGLLGDNATIFWKMVEPFILDELKELLKAGGDSDGSLETRRVNFDSESESDEKNSGYSDADTS